MKISASNFCKKIIEKLHCCNITEFKLPPNTLTGASHLCSPAPGSRHTLQCWAGQVPHQQNPRRHTRSRSSALSCRSQLLLDPLSKYEFLQGQMCKPQTYIGATVALSSYSGYIHCGNRAPIPPQLLECTHRVCLHIGLI